ncbi:MAG TPA: hypothetical protein VHG91_21455, partial [Longimicrobium sp.]|nr:hypothetical protein [Longimicrobium sp.]
MPFLSLPSPRARSLSPAPPVSRSAPGARRIRRIAPLLLLPLLAACAPDRPRDDDFAALAAALESAPGIAPRLSVGTAFRRCTERVPPGGTIARADCPARRRARTGAVAALLEEFAPGQPARLRADALVDLHWDDARGKRLDASISSLRRTAELAERPAPVLADLAAALIVRAERAQSPRDLLEAYEAAERALEREPGNEAALFNRALALDRFGLVDETARAWRAYLAAD